MKNSHIFLALSALALASCSAPKDITYFQDLHPGSELKINRPDQLKIQEGDKLRILVTTPDPRLSEQFNLQTGSLNLGGASSSGSPNNQLGYTVSTEGTIDFPMLGKVFVAGLTRNQIAEAIKSQLQLRDLVKEPVVIVDYVNLGVSVLGDVRNPGRQTITKDRYTVLEALAGAGDLNITGDRTNVLIVREEVGQQKVYYVDLTNAEQLYSSPAFYLEQDDVVYVTPNDKKKRESTINGNTVLTYSFWMSLGSFLMSLCVLIFR